MANRSHKRDTNARRKPRLLLIAGPLSVAATLAVVGVGVLGSDPDVQEVVSANQASIGDHARRDKPVSRSGADRGAPLEVKKLATSARFAGDAQLKATRNAVANASVDLWTTEELNLWDGPTDEATQLGTIESGKKVLTTGRELNARAEVVVDGESRWVTAEYLADEKPVEGPAGLGGSCTNGTSVASGVSPNIVKVHEAVCAAFPEITTYGTFRGDGEHAQGIAVDIMVSGARGWEVAEFVRAHASELGVSYAIYSQKIWSVQRSSEGWRGMSDRGSTTANHYDHVHVTTY
ncbi:hypothetical protein ncot_12485 [Nocardioides sp. JQ2195]|uniref:hypothetical protein n=1 Tax=Nocardioides sp. JQ2195 TaxID=2592334 RepID=UPI00143E1F84|nr:hypothetical protein [Nocardioides sp. JQ2195]QIX27327.1 hypothetical protein ncot_12485 [Nocardioides sp. JQ2195]